MPQAFPNLIFQNRDFKTEFPIIGKLGDGIFQ